MNIDVLDIGLDIDVTLPSIPEETEVHDVHFDHNHDDNHDRDSIVTDEKHQLLAVNEHPFQKIQPRKPPNVTKWVVLACITLSWVSNYYCFSSIFTMKDILSSNYGMSNFQFVLSFGIVFLASIIGGLISIKLIIKYDVYKSLIITQFIATVGQIIFLIGCSLADYLYNPNYHSINNVTKNPFFYLSFIYVACGLLGISIGSGSVLVLLITKIWFENTKWLATANMIAGSILLELGTLPPKYIPIIIYQFNNNNLLWQTFLPNFILTSISLITSFVAFKIVESIELRLRLLSISPRTFKNMSKIEEEQLQRQRQRQQEEAEAELEAEANKQINPWMSVVENIDRERERERSNRNDRPGTLLDSVENTIITIPCYKYNNNRAIDMGDYDEEESISNIISNSRLFTKQFWYIVCIFLFGINTYVMSFVKIKEPFIELFEFSRLSDIDFIICGGIVISVFFVPLWSYISYRIQDGNLHLVLNIYVRIFVSGAMILCIGFLIVVTCTYHLGSGLNFLGLINPIPWIVMVVENIGILWLWSFGWCVLYNNCPKHLQATMISLVTMLYFISAAIEIEIFGVINQFYGYIVSLVMVAVISLTGVIISRSIV